MSLSMYVDFTCRDIVFCGENLVDTGYTWRKQPGASAGAGGGANNGVQQSINDNSNSNNNKNSNNGNGYGHFKLPFKYVLAPIHLSQLTNSGIEMPGYPSPHMVYTPVLKSYAPVPMQPAQPSPPKPVVPMLPSFSFSPAPVPSSIYAPSMSYSPAVAPMMSYSPAVAPMTSYPPAATPSTSYSPRTAPVTSYRPANMFPYSPSKSEPIMDTPSSSYVPTKSYMTDENNDYVSSATRSRYGLQNRKRGKSFTFYFLNSRNRDNEGQRYYR